MVLSLASCEPGQGESRGVTIHTPMEISRAVDFPTAFLCTRVTPSCAGRAERLLRPVAGPGLPLGTLPLGVVQVRGWGLVAAR